MIPGTTGTLRALADKETVDDRLGITPSSSGYLQGFLTSPLYLAALGVALLILGGFFFVVAYVAGDYETGFGHLPPGGSAYAWTIIAIIVLLGGALYMFLALIAFYARQSEMRDDEFRTEPRNYDSYTGLGGTHYHEVVKVRCRYCGTLNEPSATNCIACGGIP